MRLAINVRNIKTGSLPLAEEDIEIAIGKVYGSGVRDTITVTEQGGDCFTCDSSDTAYPDIEALRRQIMEDTGSDVKIELFADWNRGY